MRPDFAPHDFPGSRMIGCLIVLVVIVATAVIASSASAQSQRFDLYDKGAKTGELEFSEGSHRLRSRDLADGSWTDWRAAEGSDREGARALHGPLGEFPRSFRALSEIDWRHVQAIGWPTADDIFTRERMITADTPWGQETAGYWAARDASLPVDLIVGQDNRILAAVDLYNDRVAVRPGYENFTALSGWREVSQPIFGYRALPLQMMETRAGFDLATRVYLPRGEGPFPTLLVRTPYGITNLFSRYEHFAVRGYAVVLQEVRGTSYSDPESLSEGTWDMMLQEVPDGKDAIEWIVDQPWSNGELCSDGISYYGYTQWALSMARHPAYKCIIAESSMGTPFSDQPFMGGTMIQGMAYYVFWMHDKPLLPGRNWADVFRHRPLADIDEYATGVDLPIWNRFFEHPTNDELWAPNNWYTGEHPREFGTLQISGWFDDDYPGTRSNWELMQRFGTETDKLIIGPWKHSYNRDRRLNGFSFGADAVRPDIHLTKIRFLDHHLRDAQNGVGEPTVEYFMLGANEWRSASAWPPDEVRPTPYYLHSQGMANITQADGSLTLAAPVGEEPAERYVYDPGDPVRNWADFDALERWEDIQSFPYDFRDIERRQDVVTFTSEPLEEAVEIAGNILVTLYASTDAKDTDWWVHISDVAPDLTSTRLGVGVIRARFRDLDDPEFHAFGSNFEEERLLSGNIEDIVEYRLSIPGVANAFKPGHRIRIAVFNALEGYSFPNSNTGEDEGYTTRAIPAAMVVHHSAGAPSHVILPVVPADSGEEN